MIPFGVFHGSKPDLSHLHVFGCQSFVLNEVSKKLDSKAREAILLGYSGNSKAYVVASTDGSKTRAPNVWVSQNVDAYPYQRGSAVTQGESEDDDASQSEVDDLKSGLDEQCEAQSTKTHAPRAHQKMTSIQMKGHPTLQTVQQQCSRRQPDVQEGLEERLKTSVTM